MSNASTPKAAMILAAGFGKRMRPLTETTPKPLLEVGGRTMLDRTLDKAVDVGVAKAVVNAHYLAEQIEKVAEARSDLEVTVSHEEEILETGGGVLNALPALDGSPFYVLNSDTVWDDGPTPALGRMASLWDPVRMDALLLLQPTVAAFGYGGRGDFYMDLEGRLTRRGESDVAPFVFTGNQILSPVLFDGLEPGRFSLNKVHDRALESERLFGIRHDGAWYHVGTPENLEQVNRIFAHMTQPVHL